MRRALVTGGAGFIGSHLCDRLIERGSDVLCLDSFVSGHRRNIEHLLAHRSFLLVEADVTEPIEAAVDEIYNLACPASPRVYQADPVGTIKTCVLGALNVLELAKRNGARVLQASTSEVYGDPHVHPQHEAYWGNVNPVGERSSYDEGKRCAEALFCAYRRDHGVDAKIVRIFNTYGPRMARDDGRVIPNLVSLALEGRELTVFGDGSQTRSFCYIDDLVDGLLAMMASTAAGPINLGNPTETTILDLAEAIRVATGTTSRLTFRPRPTDDPRRRKPQIDLARELLGWSPATSLREGLERTIVDLRAHDLGPQRQEPRSPTDPASSVIRPRPRD